MKKWKLFPWLVLLLILFSEIPPAKPRACPSACKDGSIRPQCKCEKCEFEWFWSMRNGEIKCNECTKSCADNDLIEVTPCKNKTDRKCQCKPGFFCRSPVEQTCRRRCEQCAPGSFTSSNNLNMSCQKFTDCTRLGKVVIKEGSATSDRVCGNPPTPPNTKVVTEEGAPTSELETASTTNRSNGPYTDGTNEGPLPQYDTLTKTTFILLVLLIMFFLGVLMCLAKMCKSRAIKSKLRWADVLYGRHVTGCPTASPNPSMETSVPVGNVTDPLTKRAQGQSSFPGKDQQVTVEHVGKADGINNTVGSIFIYSPGMVILGSNSNEKKEEAETSVEDSSENTCLISVPQQESSTEEDFVRLATQEELGKELSIPIPATSK